VIDGGKEDEEGGGRARDDEVGRESSPAGGVTRDCARNDSECKRMACRKEEGAIRAQEENEEAANISPPTKLNMISSSY
jgi:hypothetical protein